MITAELLGAMPGSRTSPGSIHQTPVTHRLSREAISTSSPFSPFTYRWPTDEVREVVEKAQFLELVRHSGWLLKQHGNGPHPSWSRRWVRISPSVGCPMDPPVFSDQYACSFIFWMTACATLMSLGKLKMCATSLWTAFLSGHYLGVMALRLASLL